MGVPFLPRRQKRAGCHGYEAAGGKPKGRLGRVSLLLLVAVLSFTPSGLMVSRTLVSRMLVQPQASRGPAPGVSPELTPAAEPLPAALSEAGPPHASERVALPKLRIGPATINVAMATDEDQPIGLLAVLNSTLSHCTSPGLRFHLIVPAGQRKPLRLALESLFGQASFRMYSLDAGGVRSKIQHHLKRREKDPVYVSPFRFAVAYLPQLLPAVKRALWLHTDVLVQADVAPLYRTPLRGAPVAAVEDCAHTVRDALNASHVAVAGLKAHACLFNSGVMVVDLVQWALLDIASRVEYWMDINLRTATLYAPHAPFPPLFLALHPLYARLPPASNVAGLGRRRLSESELGFWRDFWARRGRQYQPSVAAPHLVLFETPSPGGAAVLHYSGKFKPWLGGGGGGKQGVAECEAPGGARQPCKELWEPYAARALQTLTWRQPTAAGAAARAAAAAVAEAGTDRADVAPLAPLPQEMRAEVARGFMYVAVVSDAEEAPYGVFGMINSSLVHCTSPKRLHFMVVAARPELLSRQLGRAFPDASISVLSAPYERLARLEARLAPLGVRTPPLQMPLLWLPYVLPAEVGRTLLLSADTLVLTDLAEVWGVALGGKVAAVVEDCSVLFEVYFNYRHALFKGHSRSACAFDAASLLLDLRQWRKEEMGVKLLELVGLSRRTEGLYAQPSYAADTQVAAVAPAAPCVRLASALRPLLRFSQSSPPVCRCRCCWRSAGARSNCLADGLPAGWGASAGLTAR